MKIDKDIINGVKFGFGFLLIIGLFLGLVFAGTHLANQVIPGTFIGNFIFQGNTSFNGNTSYNGSVEINGLIKLNTSLSSDCNLNTTGSIKFNSTSNNFEGCINNSWQPINLGYSLGSQLNPATSCKEILDAGDSIGDGTYWVDPFQNDTSFQVYCDMTTDGGGWTLIAKSCVPYLTAGTGWGSNLGDYEYTPSAIATFACPLGQSSAGGKLSNTKIQAIWNNSGQKELMCMRGDYKDWVKNTNMNNGVWVWSDNSGYDPGTGSDYNSYTGILTSIPSTANNYFGWWNSGTNSGCSISYSVNWAITTRTRGNNWAEYHSVYMIR